MRPRRARQEPGESQVLHHLCPDHGAAGTVPVPPALWWTPTRRNWCRFTRSIRCMRCGRWMSSRRLWYRDRIRAGVFGDPRDPATPIDVSIKLKDEKDYSVDPHDRGRNSVVDYVDPIIERSTGTRTLRATFENVRKKGPKGELLPPLLSAGDSVRVPPQGGSAHQVLTVPESCSASNGSNTSTSRAQGAAGDRARSRVRRDGGSESPRLLDRSDRPGQERHSDRR